MYEVWWDRSQRNRKKKGEEELEMKLWNFCKELTWIFVQLECLFNMANNNSMLPVKVNLLKLQWGRQERVAETVLTGCSVWEGFQAALQYKHHKGSTYANPSSLNLEPCPIFSKRKVCMYFIQNLKFRWVVAVQCFKFEGIFEISTKIQCYLLQ